MRREGFAIIVIVFACLFGACNSQKFPAPTSISRPTPPAPPPAVPTPPAEPGPPPAIVERRGFVMDTSFYGLAGVTVTILDGPSAGQAVTTDEYGYFRMSTHDYPVTLRAEKAGYVTAEKPAGPPHLWQMMLRPDASVSIEPGAYTVTISLDQACVAIPEEYRSQTFPAVIAPALDIAPANIYRLTVPGKGEFIFGAAGDRVSFEPESLGDVLSWQVPPSRAFWVGPYLVETVSPLSMRANYFYCEGKPGVTRGSCFSGPVSEVVVRVLCSARLVVTRVPPPPPLRPNNRR
jgi:hypothetical protein